jgi:hypothetical protein
VTMDGLGERSGQGVLDSRVRRKGIEYVEREIESGIYRDRLYACACYMPSWCSGSEFHTNLIIYNLINPLPLLKLIFMKCVYF